MATRFKALSQSRLKPVPGQRYLRFQAWHNQDRPVILIVRLLAQGFQEPGRMVIELYPHMKVQACLDLAHVENARAHYARQTGLGIVFNSGPIVKLDAIEGVVFGVQDPPQGLKLTIKQAAITVQEGPRKVLAPKTPLVDKYGQSLRMRARARVGAEPARPSAPARFKISKINGRDWFISPDGDPFFSIGMNCVRPFSGGPVKGLEKLHTWIPPRNGPLSEAWMGEKAAEVSYYTANLIRRYGKDWRQAWARQANARLLSWGFNTIGNWSHPLSWEQGQMPYTVNAGWWDVPRPKGDGPWGLYNGFPDVFSPAFSRHCEAAAKKGCKPGDPMLLGYFVLNEPPWQRTDFHLAKLALETDRAPHTRRALQRLLKGKKPGPARLDGLREAMVDRYFKVVCGALRKADPQALLLGIRFYGIPPQFLLKAMKYMDVVSLNNYAALPEIGLLRRLHQATKKPLLLGEYHIGAAQDGMFHGLVGAPNQAERAKAYAGYIEAAAALPYCVGAHWFQWVDQPMLGRFDGENYNIGFVDVRDRPYPGLVRAAAASHLRVPAIHAGRLRPGKAKAKIEATGLAW